jgi:anti-sigma B factor antagonist
MEVTKTTQDGKMILSVSGKLSAATADEFGVIVEGALAESLDVIMDFKEVSYLASAGLRILVSAQKKIKAGNGKMVFRNVCESVLEVFEVTGLDDVFDIE